MLQKHLLPLPLLAATARYWCRQQPLPLRLQLNEDALVAYADANGFSMGVGRNVGMAGLGTRIVTSFVQDLRGRIRWEKREPTGTKVEFVARLRSLSR